VAALAGFDDLATLAKVLNGGHNLDGHHTTWLVTSRTSANMTRLSQRDLAGADAASSRQLGITRFSI
jgi:hypothetical protein